MTGLQAVLLWEIAYAMYCHYQLGSTVHVAQTNASILKTKLTAVQHLCLHLFHHLDQLIYHHQYHHQFLQVLLLPFHHQVPHFCHHQHHLQYQVQCQHLAVISLISVLQHAGKTIQMIVQSAVQPLEALYAETFQSQLALYAAAVQMSV